MRLEPTAEAGPARINPARAPRRRALSSLLGKALGVLGVTLALYLLLDLSLAALIGSPHPPVPDFAGIPALRGQPYITPAFAAEYVRNDMLESAPDGRLMWQPLRRGTYFNVEALPPTGAHYRRTLNPPAGTKPVLTVLFLGGSTVYGTEVPDELTLPSLLSERLNALDSRHGYVVYNAGVQSATSLQQVWRLQYELAHGLRPDLVIDMGGGVDIVRGVYQGQPNQPSAVGRGPLGELIHAYFPLNAYRWLKVWLAERAARSGSRKAPTHLADPTRLARLVEETARGYAASQQRLAQLARAAHARFIAVLEPDLYAATFTHPAADFDFADRQASIRSPGLADSIRASRPALSAALAGLRRGGVEALDLSQAFRDKTAEVFVDYGHFNALGNAILAKRIADAVLGRAPGTEP